MISINLCVPHARQVLATECLVGGLLCLSALESKLPSARVKLVPTEDFSWLLHKFTQRPEAANMAANEKRR